MPDVAVCTRCGEGLSRPLLDRDFGGICPFCLGSLLARDATALPLLREGDEFRGYVIREVIGRGGMGTVYRAFQRSLHRDVALKILSPERAWSVGFRSRFEREAKALASLNHPNIVQVYDFGQEGDVLYLAMERVEGTDLQTLLNACDRGELLRILRDVARGLGVIHDAGLVHRDITPSNVLVTRKGDVKIADFGIAIEADGERRCTETGSFVGTPSYVSPEHVQGKRVDGRADLYSLGVILYQGLAGRPPFLAPHPTALLFKHVQERPPALGEDVPRRLTTLAGRLLEKDPSDRPGSAKAVEEELDRILKDPLRAPAFPRALMNVLTAALLVAVAAWIAIGTRAKAPSSSGKPSPPDEETLQKHGSLLEDLRGADRREMARKLLRRGIESREGGPGIYLLLRESRDVATEAGDAATACQAIAELGKRYDVDGCSMVFSALSSIAAQAKTAEEFLALARAYRMLSEESLRSGDAGAAAQAARAGLDAARKGGDSSVLRVLEEQVRDLAGGKRPPPKENC